MINSITVTNHLNESITMDMRFPEKSGFLIYSIDGLGPPKADINFTDLSLIDGSIYNSARANKRNIIFSFLFMMKPDIETMRKLSYKYFPVKQRIKVAIESDSREVEAYGFVESNEPNIFSNIAGCTISILCPDAYLFDINDNIIYFSTITSLFEFPFSNESLVTPLIELSSLLSNPQELIYNPGDISVGMIIYIHATGSANDVEIINSITLETLSIDSTEIVSITGSDISAGDDITISTVKGNKYAILKRSTTTYNILNALGQNPIWLQLEVGDNVFAFDANTGLSNLFFLIEAKILYEGI